MDGKQIYDNFRQGDTSGLRGVADQVATLSSSYLDRAQGIKALQDRMNQAWTGNAADAANAGAGPLAQAFRQTAEPLDTTKASVDMQAETFEASNHAVVEVPPKPDKPSPWSIGLKSAIPIAGPFMAADDVKSYQDGMKAYNAANERNVRVMDQYSNATTSTQSALPTDYGVLKSDGATISITQPETPPEIGGWPGKTTQKQRRTGGGPDDSTSTTSNNPTGHDTGRQTGTDSHKGTDGTDRPGQTGQTGNDDDTHTSRTGPGRLPTQPIPGRPGERLPGGPPSEQDPSLLGIPGQGPQFGGGPGNPGGNFDEPGGPSGRSGSAGSRLLDSAGRGGAGGLGEPEGGRGVGAGGRTGAGGFGNAAAQEAAAARAAGRPGQMGPMGPHGQRGEGEEDTEHQRPDYLVEADPDAIFGTDQRTSPPVIGE